MSTPTLLPSFGTCIAGAVVRHSCARAACAFARRPKSAVGINPRNREGTSKLWRYRVINPTMRLSCKLELWATTHSCPGFHPFLPRFCTFGPLVCRLSPL